VRAVADPVHEGENPLVEARPREVVLHDDDSGGPDALGQERDGVVRMVEDVDEEGRVGLAVRERQAPAVEGVDGDRA
jgi:hypothetical protein